MDVVAKSVAQLRQELQASRLNREGSGSAARTAVHASRRLVPTACIDVARAGGLAAEKIKGSMST